MNDARLAKDDPRLTAYALGELDAVEVPMVEAALRADPGLRAEVEEIRRSAAAIETALAVETAPGRTPSEAAPEPARTRPRRRWIVFPQFYFVVGGLAAAGFAVLVSVNRERIEEKERVRAENLRAALGQPRVAGHDAQDSARVALELVPATTAAVAGREGLVITPDFGEAAYATVRRFVEARQLPPSDVVQPAELVNAFRYRSPAESAATEAKPLAATLETGDAPRVPGRQWVRLGFRAREATLEEVRQSIMADAARSRATIARDVRIQVEFNPARVAGYRLIGRDDEAGPSTRQPDELATARQLQSGQGFTALYEIVPAAPPPGLGAGAGDLLTVHLSFVGVTGGPRQMLEFSLADRGAGGGPLEPSADFQLASAVAEFALVLRQATMPDRAAAMREVLLRATNATFNEADDPDGRRAEFVELVRLTQSLLE
jgi:anti-sigma factor RsiW